MEAFYQLGILPFLGICAGTGAIAFLVTRAVTPAKPCEMKMSADNEYAQWASQEGRYTHFEPGKRRLVHVSRGAIGSNMKGRQNYWPTGVVIDENGKKHEFHEIFTHAPGTLLFDVDGETANVYLVTYGQISGLHLRSLPTKFVEEIKMPETPTATLKAEIETLQRKLKEAEGLIIERDTQLELLRVTRTQLDKQVVDNETQVRSVIEEQRRQLSKLTSELAAEVQPHTVLPLAKNIDLGNQTRVEKHSREVKIGRGCSSYYETEYYDKVVSIQPGEEGYIDTKKQVRYARVRNRLIKEEIVAVPLQEGELGYIAPDKPIPC